MSRIAYSNADVRRTHLRREYVPIASTVAACLLTLLPVVTTTPLMPDFGFLVLIAWRLLRPEMWSPLVALPLGLFNDLVGGHPVGQSMAIWTTLFILFDIADSRVLYRDYWMDWLIAALAIVAGIFADWYLGHLMGNAAPFGVMWPQIAASIFAYPIVSRLVLGLDRWRLAR